MSSTPHDQSHSEVRKRELSSGELLLALPEGTASCSDVVPACPQIGQVVSSQSGCQAVTESCDPASDHSFVMTQGGLNMCHFILGRTYYLHLTATGNLL